MRRLITRGWGVVMAVAVAGCHAPDASQADNGAGEPTRIAVINGEDIWDQDFRSFCTAVRGEWGEGQEPVSERELFREFVAARLLLQEARRQGITVSEDQVQHYVQSWTPRGGALDSQFSDRIYDFLVTQELLREKAVSKAPVTLREMQAYYDRNQAEFEVQDQVHVLEILTEDEATAARIRRGLADGDFSRFRDAARLYSVGMTAESGGDLGIFQKGELPEDFDRVIFALKPGQISEPFQSGHGFHLFMVEERIPRHVQKFHEVREQIFQTLTAAREREGVEQYIENLFRRAEISILDPDLVLEEVVQHEKK